MTDIVVSKCDTALAAGNVSVPVYPPSNGPSVSDEDAVVLVVSVPDALAGFDGGRVGRMGGFMLALVVHDESVRPNAPTAKSIDGSKNRAARARENIPTPNGNTSTQPHMDCAGRPYRFTARPACYPLPGAAEPLPISNDSYPVEMQPNS